MRTMIVVDDERLIQLVRSHPQLYDVTHPEYVDTDKRAQIWREISEELDTDATFCKRRWNNIRDNYRKSLRRISPMTKYRFASKLEFLNDHFHDKDPLVTNGFNISKTEYEEQTSDYLDDFDNNTSHNEISAEIIFDDENNDDDDASNQSNNFSSSRTVDKIKMESQSLNYSSATSSKLSKRRKRAETNQRNSTSKRPTFGESSSDIQSTSITQAEAVDAFLAGIAPTLKTLTPHYLNLAKTKIFSVVQEYELAMILEQQKSSTPTTADKS